MASGAIPTGILPVSEGGTGAASADAALSNLGIPKMYIASGQAPCDLITVPYGVYVAFIFRWGTGNVYAGNYRLAMFGVNTNSHTCTVTEFVKGANAPAMTVSANSSNRTIKIHLDGTNYQGCLLFQVFKH